MNIKFQQIYLRSLIHGNVFSDEQLFCLKQDLNASRRSAYAAGIRKNLKIQWESYLLFCVYFGLSCLPTSTENLSLYSQFLSRTLKSAQSIRNYISGVKTMNLILGYSIEHMNTFIINLGLKGIAREHPYCIKQAEPITPTILMEIYTAFDMTKSENIVYWCLFLFAFYLFARKSNLVPTVKKDLKEKKFLCHKDVECFEDTLIISMRWSKTIQFGDRILRTPLVAIPGSKLCPVKAYRHMCATVKAKGDDPLFSLSEKKCIFYKHYQAKLKAVIKQIGLDSDLYSSHSFRRGGCTFSFQSGIPAELIQLHGDWKSDAYKKYLSLTFEDKFIVAERIKQQILKL